MGDLIKMDFQNKQKQKPDGGIGAAINEIWVDDLQEKTANHDESDLLMINIKLTSGIKDSFSYLANLEKKIIAALSVNNIGLYVGWDCSHEYVSLYVTGEKAVDLCSAMVDLLKTSGFTSDTVEVMSYIQGEIQLS